LDRRGDERMNDKGGETFGWLVDGAAEEVHLPPMVSIVGHSGAGKTTLIERLIPSLKARGLAVGTVKHDVHGFDMDRPGKDSWRHKAAGASTTVLASPSRVAMVMDVERDPLPSELAPLFRGLDIVLAEGYKRGDRPKVEVFRGSDRQEPLCQGDPNLLAVVTDKNWDGGVPRFDPEDIEKLADFLVSHFGLARARRRSYS